MTYDPGGHVLAGVTFFCSSALALIVLSRRMRHDPHWRGLSAYTRAAGVVALIRFVTMAMLVVPDAAPLHSWAGAAQRLLILLVLFPCRAVLGVRSLPDRIHTEP